MNALRLHRVELFWGGLLLAVALAALVPFSPGDQARTDTWSADPTGKKIFFTLARRFLGDVRRSTERLDPPADAGTLCILGPARLPDADEWTRLRAWVASGKTLLFAASGDDATASLATFGLRVRPEAPTSAAPEHDRSLHVDETLMPPPAEAIAWSSEAWIDGGRSDAWIVARARARPVAMVQREGRGWLVAVASDELFDNASLVDPARALLAFRILERVRGTGAVVFDESLNRSGRPRVVGLLLAPALRPLTLQLVAVAVLFGWLGARRFGPIATTEPASRRFMTEHALAFGAVGHKAQAGARLVQSYLEYFRRELRVVRGATRDAAVALLAARARTDPQAVARALRRAEEVAAAGRASNAEAAQAVAALAELKQKVEHPL